MLEHFDKDNLHHAYLLEGDREKIVPEIFSFLEGLGVKTSANPDFSYLSFDSFKIEDARNLKAIEYEKGFSQVKNAKKIFIISANNFLLEAQNTLLKIFEEPIANTHFFLIVPDKNSLLKTLVSRFYFISARKDLAVELKDAEKFVGMPLKDRIDFIKEMLIEPEEGKEEIVELDSTRSKALKFLNALEVVLHKNMSRTVLDTNFFAHIFKVREFLNQPGSSAKSLMESVALIVPTV